MLWRCCLGSRKGIRPVKNWVVRCWHGYLSGARCRLAYDPAAVTATHCLLLQKIQIDFAFLVSAYPGSGKRSSFISGKLLKEIISNSQVGGRYTNGCPVEAPIKMQIIATWMNTALHMTWFKYACYIWLYISASLFLIENTFQNFYR